MSRVDAVRLAVEKAREHGHPTRGRVARVGRVLPVRRRAAGGARGRRHGDIQPGGSKRDDEVVAAVRDAGAAMVFTDRRHFRH